MPAFRSWWSYRTFEQAVRRDLRYVRSAENDEFLQTLGATASSRTIHLNAGHIFWRAQLSHEWEKVTQGDEEFEVPCASPPVRMKPLRDFAFDGRANPKGIPSLYLASSKETAMSEVRPWIGSHISVGQFKLLYDMDIIDCSRNPANGILYFEEPSPEDREKAVWSSIDRAFAEPMTRSDNTADYAATQIIAELFKQAGFGGLVYKSNFGKNGYNITLFDIDAADLINCSLYRVEGVDIKFKEEQTAYFVKKHYPD